MRIGHLAIRTSDQEKLAAFYRSTFGLTETFRHRNEGGELDIYLSDGEVSLGFFPADGMDEGLDHFGFHVENVEVVANAALAAGALRCAKRVSITGHGHEVSITDPIGERVDLSSSGWPASVRGQARIQHVAIMTDQPVELAGFYATTFGLREVFRSRAGSIYLADGFLNLAVLPNTTAPEHKDLRGIDHLGFRVDDIPSVLAAVVTNGGQLGDHALPQDGRFAEVFVRDPAGQRIDLSQVGWKTQP